LKSNIYRNLPAFLFVLITLSCHHALADKEELSYVEGELLVKFRKDAPIERALEIIREEGAETIRFLEEIGVWHIRLKPGKTVSDAVREFSGMPEVEYAEPNYKVRKAK
jgi:hypothetical protein